MQAVQPGAAGLAKSTTSRVLIVAAFVAFVAALLIHHRSDPGAIIRDVLIYPALLATGVAVAIERRWLHVVAAVLIMLPSLSVIDWPALVRFGEPIPFLNQLFLLLAGVLALAGGISALVRKRAT